MKKLLSISVVLLGLMLCFTSCEKSSTSLKGTKWEAEKGNYTYILSVTSDTNIVMECSYKGGTAQPFGVGTYTMSSQTEFAGTLTTGDYGSYPYTGVVNGNEMTVVITGFGTLQFKKVQ